MVNLCIGAQKVLVLGSGPFGVLESKLLTTYPHIEVTSVDLTPHLLGERHSALVFDFNSQLQPNLNGIFDVVVVAEVIEHVVDPDRLLRLSRHLLNNEGFMLIGWPNLASIASRIELLLGFQPHCLEASTRFPLDGTGLMGHLNSPSREVLGHLRGFTVKAMVELLKAHGFSVTSRYGFTNALTWWPKRFAVDLAGTVCLTATCND